jgi:hypothetical protein
MKSSLLSRGVSLGIVLFTFCSAPEGFGQTPEVRIYFDASFYSSNGECPPTPPGTVIDTLYIVAEHFSDQISGIEYKINFVPQLIWLQDIIPSGSAEGNTNTGVIQTWTNPQSASQKLLLMKVLFVWMCDNCFGNESVKLCPDSHPQTGYLRALKTADSAWIYPDAFSGILCQAGAVDPQCDVPVPIKESSWGHIKSLYDD